MMRSLRLVEAVPDRRLIPFRRHASAAPNAFCMSRTSWPIRTGQKHVPWFWVGMLAFPWSSMLYFEQISNVAVTFTLRELGTAPVVITAVGSFNLLFNIFVNATCNYASDRIWTPLGRRKPFLLAGWLVVAIGCLVLPQLDRLWLIVAALFLYEMLRDIAAPYESLTNEVVPPHQRGRSTATLTFARQLMSVFFFAVMIGQWDRIYRWGSIEVTGKHLVFWTGSALAIASCVLVLTCIRETPPAVRTPPRLRLTWASAWRAVRDFVQNVFGKRQWLALYAVALAQMIFWIGTSFGSLAPLLFTEQWGLSKQTYGNVIALGAPFTLFVCLPIGGWLVDRMDRLFLFKLFAASITLLHLTFFLYLQLRTGEGSPPLAVIISYWLLQTGVGNIGLVSTVSMLFDFVPRDRMGTVSSGIGIARGVASILVNNGIGLWVTAVTALTVTTAAGEDPRYDYESGFFYLVFCGLLATGVAFWFSRQVQAGRVLRLGVLEAQRNDP